MKISNTTRAIKRLWQFGVGAAAMLTSFAAVNVSGAALAADSEDAAMTETINGTVRPLMQEYHIPGMSVALTVGGKSHFYNYGVTSTKDKKPVTSETLFEIGSVSKTFTATLASYAQVKGNLSLSDVVTKHLPALSGSSFDHVSLINLGTYTAGGLPLQVPDTIGDTEQLMAYFKKWHPTYQPGTHRSYSNPSIALLGLCAAQSMKTPFDQAIEKKLFPALGLTRSYINIPSERMGDYAQGYTQAGAPARMKLGAVSSEAYGIKSCSSDMIRFVQSNMQAVPISPELQRVVDGTHTGYFKVEPFIQDLVWEQYQYPVEEKQLLAGNSEEVIYHARVATRLELPLKPQSDVWMNKTGSTNGFATYVAFIPSKKIGIVLLANKSYPIAPRVKAAYKILSQLSSH